MQVDLQAWAQFGALGLMCGWLMMKVIPLLESIRDETLENRRATLLLTLAITPTLSIAQVEARRMLDALPSAKS